MMTDQQSLSRPNLRGLCCASNLARSNLSGKVIILACELSAVKHRCYCSVSSISRFNCGSCQPVHIAIPLTRDRQPDHSSAPNCTTRRNRSLTCQQKTFSVALKPLPPYTHTTSPDVTQFWLTNTVDSYKTKSRSAAFAAVSSGLFEASVGTGRTIWSSWPHCNQLSYFR